MGTIPYYDMGEQKHQEISVDKTGATYQDTRRTEPCFLSIVLPAVLHHFQSTCSLKDGLHIDCLNLHPDTLRMA